MKKENTTFKERIVSLMQISARPLLRLIFLLIASISIAGCSSRSDAHPGEKAESALSTFELEPGFKIELVAIEPLIADPVAMEIDENGRFYVVEMHGYPLDKSGTGKVEDDRTAD